MMVFKNVSNVHSHVQLAQMTQLSVYHVILDISRKEQNVKNATKIVRLVMEIQEIALAVGTNNQFMMEY